MRLRVFLAAGAAVATLAQSVDSAAAAAPCWRPPVAGQIIEHFREPSCPYCAGKRGIEYRTSPSALVRTVEAGRVTFSGVVAGTGYVVVDHSNGWKVTYGRLLDIGVRRGDTVARGHVLGSAAHRFYFGLRVQLEYRDPEPYFGRLVGRPRLVPVDGTPRRPPPMARRSCRRP